MSNDKSNPQHYQNQVTPIDIIEMYQLNFSLGNTIKYILRAGKKDGESDLDDLNKALWYLNREIQTRTKTKTP
jgi:hypothetical protein